VPHQAKVLTVSDGVVEGVREDDGADSVAEVLRTMVEDFSGLVVTTGGTGFAPRDQTPEGTLAILDRQAPGLAEAMRLASPLGRLSRAAAGTAGTAVVLNTPGSTSGAVECLEAVLDVLPHALDLLAGRPTSH
jgi:molybdopterin adenylyltransferase